jgi:starch synthase
VYAAHPVLGGTPSVFTIHNLAYQGIFEPDWLPRLDLGWEQFAIDRLEFYGRISLLKGGINDARAITTVSRRYAEEIQTPAFGFGFDGILRARAADLTGILNGIDTREWDPARDPFLPRPFDAGDLAGKRDAKAAVLGRYGLSTDEAAMARPLVGMVSRMVDQKGFDLIAATLEDLVELDAAFVVLGTGEPRYQDMWRAIAPRFRRIAGAPDRGRVRPVPDAVAVRAVRPEPDVQHALRHRSRRQRRRRARRHGGRVFDAQQAIDGLRARRIHAPGAARSTAPRLYRFHG